MKKIILVVLAIFSVRIVSGQGTTPAAEFVATANSFKYDARYNSRCRSTAPASAIPHRDSEDFATTSEGSASCA